MSQRFRVSSGRAAIIGVVALIGTMVPMGLAQGATASNAPQRGGSITQVGLAVDPTIDPAFNFVSSNTDEPTVEAVYGPGLVYLNPQTSAVEMGFAQSLTTKNNGATWTLVLHPGLKFSDGTAFNAAAVAYNIARFANPATGSTLQTAAAQLSTKALSATKLQIICTPADAVFPQIMSQDFAMIASPAALAAEGTKYGSHPVGPGPFQVQTFVYGASWSFVRNPYYRIFAPGQPYLNSVRVQTEGNTSQLVTALQLGEAQTVNTQNAQVVSMVRGAGLTVVAPTQPNVFFLILNTSTPPFNNVLAREAVYDAIDRSGVAGVWAAGNPVSQNLFGPKSPFYNKKYDFPKQNSAKAQQLFNQLAAQGQPVKFSILWPAAAGIGNVGAYVIAALSQYQNVTVNQDSEPVTQYNTQLRSSGFQMTGYSVGSPIPGAFQVFESNGNLNYGKWNDPTVDAALNKLQQTTNLDKQKQLWSTVQQQIVTQYPYVWTQRGIQGYGYNKKEVGGVSLTEYGQVAFWGPMYRK